MRRIDVAERRARLGRRHRLLPGDRAADPAEAARSVVCLHATDPATVYLSAWARVDGFTVEAMDSALYDDRSLVKHLAMRRTLFAFPRDLLPAAQAGASARVAAAERPRLARWVEKAGLVEDGTAWLDTACAAVVDALAGGRELTSTELREELPVLEGSISYGEGKSWAGTAPVGPRVLTVLSADGLVVRAGNNGAWTTSRPRWASMRSWVGELPPMDPAEGTRELVRQWLRAFGPGTERDLKWWLGGTLTAVRRALAELDAVAVDLAGAVGFVLPDDLEPVDPPEPWAALLPSLDPTTMGWSERDWYLGEHRVEVFDTNGNAGTTAWWDGHIVGGWGQEPDGQVRLDLLEDVGADARAALEQEAQRLGEWLRQRLGGGRILERYPSPLTKQRRRG